MLLHIVKNSDFKNKINSSKLLLTKEKQVFLIVEKNKTTNNEKSSQIKMIFIYLIFVLLIFSRYLD